MPQPVRSILITGCSTGIGHHAAHGLNKEGWRVFAAARKPEDVARLREEGLEALRLDYNDEATMDAALETVMSETGGALDALFNNGGFAQAGALEDLDTALLRAQFETNVFGWHALTRKVVPVMRNQGGGRIVFCSSILGLVGARYRGAYVASKHAIEGYADSLRAELHDDGIKVVLIEPGPITSAFRNNAIATIRQTVDIDGSVHAAKYKRDLAGRTDGHTKDPFRKGPEAVLAVLRKALNARKPKARYPVTIPAHVGAFLRRALPDSLMDRIVRGSGRKVEGKAK